MNTHPGPRPSRDDPEILSVDVDAAELRELSDIYTQYRPALV